MSNGGGAHRQQPMKVTIIETQFVEAEASQFKMVVQKFTGKDSTVARRHGRETKKMIRDEHVTGRKREPQAEAEAEAAAGGELDGTVVEMWPSFEELCELLGE